MGDALENKSHLMGTVLGGWQEDLSEATIGKWKPAGYGAVGPIEKLALKLPK